MAVVKEIAKNILIKVPFVYKMAKKKHITGINQSEEGVTELYERYKRFVDFDNKNVLELGPGHTYGVSLKILQNGARSVTMIDTKKYIPDQVFKDHPDLKYIIYPGKEMPVKDRQFDVIVSNNVYEHLHSPEKIIRETFRVLKPGGTAVHFVDLGDHLYYGRNPTKVFNCLRYSKTVWNLMSSNRSIFVNRLRRSDWIRLHQEAGFTVSGNEGTYNNLIRDLYNQEKLSFLSRYKPEDRFISAIILTVKR